MFLYSIRSRDLSEKWQAFFQMIRWVIQKSVAKICRIITLIIVINFQSYVSFALQSPFLNVDLAKIMHCRCINCLPLSLSYLTLCWPFITPPTNLLQAKESDVGAVYRVAGPLVIAENMTGAAMWVHLILWVQPILSPKWISVPARGKTKEVTRASVERCTVGFFMKVTSQNSLHCVASFIRDRLVKVRAGASWPPKVSWRNHQARRRHRLYSGHR